MKQREILEKLNKMTHDQLSQELEKAYLESRKTRLEVEARKSQDHAEARAARKYVAQILTLLNKEEE